MLVTADTDVDITAGARMDLVVGSAATVTSSGTVDINASTALTMQATGEGSTVLIEGEAGNVTMVARGNTSDLTLESASQDVIVQAGEDVLLTATTGVISMASTASEVSMTAATDATITASNGTLELSSPSGVVDIEGAGGVTLTASSENATMLVEAVDGGVEVVARGAARDLTLHSL